MISSWQSRARHAHTREEEEPTPLHQIQNSNNASACFVLYILYLSLSAGGLFVCKSCPDCTSDAVYIPIYIYRNSMCTHVYIIYTYIIYACATATMYYYLCDRETGKKPYARTYRDVTIEQHIYTHIRVPVLCLCVLMHYTCARLYLEFRVFWRVILRESWS